MSAELGGDGHAGLLSIFDNIDLIPCSKRLKYSVPCFSFKTLFQYYFMLESSLFEHCVRMVSVSLTVEI